MSKPKNLGDIMQDIQRIHDETTIPLVMARQHIYSAYNQGLDAASARITELEALLAQAREGWECLLNTMTAINQHMGYQFTQPLMASRDLLAALKAAGFGAKGDGG